MSARRLVAVLVLLAVAIASFVVFMVRVALGLVIAADGSAVLGLASIVVAALLVLVPSPRAVR